MKNHTTAPAHANIGNGHCAICGHYGSGCTRTDAPAHTPGPWRIEEDRSIFSGGVGIVDEHDVVVAHLEPWDEDAPDQARANAHLIRTAPDLLEALEDQIEDWEAFLSGEWDGNHEGIRTTLNRLNAVVQKARGR